MAVVAPGWVGRLVARWLLWHRRRGAWERRMLSGSSTREEAARKQGLIRAVVELDGTPLMSDVLYRSERYFASIGPNAHIAVGNWGTSAPLPGDRITFLNEPGLVLHYEVVEGDGVHPPTLPVVDADDGDLIPTTFVPMDAQSPDSSGATFTSRPEVPAGPAALDGKGGTGG